MSPEHNPADDVQPTKEEWEAYEKRESPLIPRTDIVQIFERVCKESPVLSRLNLSKNHDGKYSDRDTCNVFEGFFIGIRCSHRMLKNGFFPNIADAP